MRELRAEATDSNILYNRRFPFKVPVLGMGEGSGGDHGERNSNFSAAAKLNPHGGPKASHVWKRCAADAAVVRSLIIVGC